LSYTQQTPLKDAFYFSEANKAATLNLAMQANEALFAAGIPENLNALQQEYKRELTVCNQQLETVLKPETKEDTLKKQYYENRRFTYSAKFDSLITSIRKILSPVLRVEIRDFCSRHRYFAKNAFSAKPEYGYRRIPRKRYGAICVCY
jgi:hypothetical protein